MAKEIACFGGCSLNIPRECPPKCPDRILVERDQSPQAGQEADVTLNDLLEAIGRLETDMEDTGTMCQACSAYSKTHGGSVAAYSTLIGMRDEVAKIKRLIGR